MKKSTLIVAVFSLMMFSFKGTGADDGNTDKYCLKLRDGRLTLMHHNAVISADVVLDNGWIIKPDGTVIKKDGSKTSLTEGQCIDRDGTIYAKEKKSRHE